MNKRSSIVTILCAAGILCVIGCYPKHIVWTPDGQQAAIWNDQGLFFCDAQGGLSSMKMAGVCGVEWAPDGRHLAIVKDIYAQQWKEVEAKIPRELREDLVRYAKTLFDVKDQAQWEEGTQLLLEQHKISKNEIQGVKLYIRDNRPRGFPVKLIESWQNECDFHCYSLQVGQWNNDKFSLGKTLYASAQRIYEHRFSSNGRMLAFTTAYPKFDDDEAEEDRNIHSLWVADTESGQVALVDTNVALFPDWDAAGTSLVYVRSMDRIKSAYALGTLLQAEVCDENGALIGKPSPPKALAGLIANEHTKLRCLSDGRIIFSSMEMTLPFVEKDMPNPPQFFVLDAKRQATISHLIPRGVLPHMYDYNISFFEVSPDETKLAFPDNDGRVGVLSIATGEFKVLQETNLEGVCTVPVWRTPRDLCYAAGPVKGLFSKGPFNRVVLHGCQEDGTWDDPRCISKDWSTTAKTGWLEPHEKKD